MGFIQLVEDGREAQQIGRREDGDREGSVAYARGLERPREDGLQGCLSP